MSTLTDGDDLSPELQAAVSAILEIGLEFKVHLHHPPLPFKTAVDDEGNPSTCYSVAPPTTTAASPWDPDIQKQSPSYLLIPTPRITACIACRAIHRKCSSSGGGGTATQPCSRCVKQKLECVYTTTTDSFAPSVSRDGLSTKRSANLVSGSFDEGGDQMGLEQDTCTAVPPLEKRKKQQIESKGKKKKVYIMYGLCIYY
ncbi:hypothetical protein BDR26DRAFT_860739 [Obelidium mucronatum]|nr:hypothetical protein BDR26DRAFT_860739 [Obelidium mucronatum]